MIETHRGRGDGRRLLGLGILLGLLLAPAVWWVVRQATDRPVYSGIDRQALQEIQERLRAAPDQSSVFVDVAALLQPSTVSIHTAILRGRFEVGQGLGSGIVLDEDGHVLTNAHVVLDGRGRPFDAYHVVLQGYGVVEGEFVGADLYTDLAVLRIDVRGLLPATLGDSEALRLGEMVMAVGTPFGLEDSVSLGIVSAMGRADLDLAPFENFIQTDAAINPGNSGGPLVNLRGEVVGVNTAIRSENRQYAGIGFAIPVNTARYVASELIGNGAVRRGYLGVNRFEATFAPTRRRARGVRVGTVLDGTPADRAGLETDDVILAIDGSPVRSFRVLQDRIAHTAPGTVIRLRILRGEDERDLEVTLGERPPE